jgi:hypothetical protein
VGAEHNVNDGRLAQNLTLIFLRQTSANGDLHAWIRGFDGHQMTQISIKFVVGIFTNRTCIKDYEVGNHAFLNWRVARGLE